jgi:ribosome biogenesis GTPase
MDEIKKYISRGKTFCFLGSSGVGKSSLINTLIGANSIKTGEISSYSDRGKHTTTSRQMYFLENGGILIDNPGIREIGITATAFEIDNFFNNISDLAPKCKYKDCTHTHEPGCKVIEAKNAGAISEDQYSNYLDIQKEAEYSEMNDFEKKKKDRQFGKFIKKAKEDLEKI